MLFKFASIFSILFICLQKNFIVIKYHKAKPGATIIKEIRILLGIFKNKISIFATNIFIMKLSISIRMVTPEINNMNIKITIALIRGNL